MSQNTIQLSRLARLITVLQEVHQKGYGSSFDLASWINHKAGRAVDPQTPTTHRKLEEAYLHLMKIDPLAIPHSCGTTACACGYAGLDPLLRAEGFETRSDGHVQCFNAEDGRMHYDWDAVQWFFGLRLDEAMHLFSMMKYPAGHTILDVIVRVEKFIQDNVTQDIPN